MLHYSHYKTPCCRWGTQSHNILYNTKSFTKRNSNSLSERFHVEFCVSIFENFANFVCRRDFYKRIVFYLDLDKYLLSLLDRLPIKFFRRIRDCPFACLYFLFTLFMIKSYKRVRVGLITIVFEEIFWAKVEEKHIYLLIVLRHWILLK